MIEILPMEDREKERSLLERLPLSGGEARVLLMKDKGEPLGHAAVELWEDTLRILKLEAAGWDSSQKPQGEQIFILDTLMRSAASYGETFGAGKIETAFPDFFGFFQARGFETDDAHSFGPMSLIVKYE
ncbi:hypothetical protein D1841_03815 [Neglecta sp. X4]|uniref:hypothetical protein n=1 Tax=unclassified Neglectibacter TaxID=2632164 RepID=UPI00136E13A6|nr:MULTISPECIES: hypothetical protein [unclassified Neglectibacter]NBI17052.1 hypothetical protein [Neglectibacter sp. 59]NBJ72464.1 hypothetical protein [Neglectibacter sp. X4]NCE80239.1 hypothetical protein [Neglectibacter sp. X58]